MKRTKVKIVAVKEEPGTPCWPCIDHDADRELARVIAPIRENNPGMDFDVVSYTQLWQAEADYEKDAQIYDGVLVLLMTCWKDIDKFYAAQSKEGIPTIIADVPYCGSGSLLMSAVPFVRENRLPVPILSTLNYAEIADAVKIFDVLAKIKQTTVLVVSNKPNIREKCAPFAKEWGCSFVIKGGDDLLSYMEKADDTEARAIADRWIAGADEVLEATDADILESARVHIALREMMKDVGAQAVTVACLSLSYSGAYGEKRHFYPCLSHFEMLNNGTVAVCEADIAGTVTSLALFYLTGKPGFVSDPVIDTSAQQIIYAHCVACNKVYGCNDPRTCRYSIRSHAEDKKGASVQVFFPAGDELTTAMFYSSDRCPSVIHSSTAVGNAGHQEACRSKLAAKTRAENIMNNWSGGWHRVTVFGEYRKLLLHLLKAKGLAVLEEDEKA
ncbi:MAG: hypothetical protein IJX28_04245 [Clostridia bacterium]|nr:hypothetical protein [Clostridia bacterium]